MGNRKELHVTKQKFDEFVLAHGRDILWFCRMTAGNAHEGDELYQDTMLTLLEHLDRRDRKAMMRMEIFVRQDSCVLSRTCMKSVLNLHLFFSEHKVIRMCSILKWTWIFDNGSHRQ